MIFLSCTNAEFLGIESFATENRTGKNTNEEANVSYIPNERTSLIIPKDAGLRIGSEFGSNTHAVGKNSIISIYNLDTVPHNVMSGKGPSDDKSGELFDTGIIDPLHQGIINVANLDIGAGEYAFYCSLHPSKKGKLIVVNENNASSPSASSLPQRTTAQEYEQPSFTGPPLSTPMSRQQTAQLPPLQSFYPSTTAPTFPPPIQPDPLIILSQSSYIDNIGSLHIVGEVQNTSYETAEFVKVTATFYNSINQVVGTDFGYTDPHDLVWGQRAPFDMIVIKGSMPSYNIAYYTLNVDSS